MKVRSAKSGTKRTTRRGTKEGDTNQPSRQETQTKSFDLKNAGIGPEGAKVFGGI